MAESVEDCRRMVNAASEHGRVLAVNFNTRSGPVYRRIKQLIGEGVVGKVRVVRIIFNWSCHQWQPPERLEQFMAGGGPLMDSAVHFFDGVRWYTGQEFVRIDARWIDGDRSGLVRTCINQEKACEMTAGKAIMEKVDTTFANVQIINPMPSLHRAPASAAGLREILLTWQIPPAFRRRRPPWRYIAPGKRIFHPWYRL